jgi:pyruvate formate lyase activating enzyme
VVENTERENAEQDKKGLIFNTQSYSIHDGPGIRTTIFLKGCPLRCHWCSNPESQSPQSEIMLFDRKCIKCGKCIETCPKKAITVVNDTRTVNWAICNQCLQCAEVCPAEAIERVGNYMSQEELVAQIEKDRPYFENSGGGVTFSGGEPLMQWEFLLGVLKKCKEKNIHTALETCGHVAGDIFQEVLRYVDLVLYDLKHLDPVRHKEGTGVTNRLILENLEKISQGNIRFWLRVPLIPGFNDSPEYIKTLGEFASETRAEKISLMPFHCWGEGKYERLGKIYRYKGVPDGTVEEAEKLKKILEGFGVTVSIGR